MHYIYIDSVVRLRQMHSFIVAAENAALSEATILSLKTSLIIEMQ